MKFKRLCNKAVRIRNNHVWRQPGIFGPFPTHTRGLSLYE